MNRSRRHVIASIALAPLLATAAASRMRRLGFVSLGTPGEEMAKSLVPLGWEAGRNLRIETRVVARYGPAAPRDRLIREVLATKPEVAVAQSGACVRTLLQEAPALPIVATLWDPVREGFAKSLARPGGMVTGLSFEAPRAFLMMTDLLRLMLPRLERLHSLATPEFHADPLFLMMRDDARRQHGVELALHDVVDDAGASRALEAVGDRSREGLFLFRVPGVDGPALMQQAVRKRIAATYIEAKSGALLSCNPVHPNGSEAIASLVDKVLRGASPATLPFETPTHIAIQVNRATANALGITIPNEILVRASAIYG